MIRWGILGAGKIANRFADSLAKDPDSILYAVSGRSRKKLEAFAAKHPCEKIYVSYDEMLDDGDIDAVYLSLPHVLHREWAVRALQKKKAVLCEKPAALNEAEMREIADCAMANDTLFMEAMKPRFVPAYGKLKQMIEDGVIGDLESITASQCFMVPKEAYGKSYHTVPEGGGALLDSGIYCVSLAEDFLKGEPVPVQTYANYHGFDIYTDSTLCFDNGTARIIAGFDRTEPRDAVFTGTKGIIRVKDLHRPVTFTVCTENGEETYEFPYENDDFYSEIRHFVSLIKEGKKESDVMTYDTMIREAHITDVIFSQIARYDDHDLEILEAQEQQLAPASFNSADALALGSVIASLAGEYDRGVAVRITRCSDDTAVFQYVMDDKKAANLMYAEGKKACVADTGHSSAWVYAKTMKDGTYADWLTDGRHVISGGAFPLYVNGEITYIVQVSGLHEGKDHELIVRTLSAWQNDREYTHFIKSIG